MFLMIGFSDGRKDLNFTQNVICRCCGSYGRYQVYMTFTQLLLFFIPCFKWNKVYYVRMSCCGAVYELIPDKGRAIARGEDVIIEDEDLTLVSGNAGSNAYSGPQYGGSAYGNPYRNANPYSKKKCPYCGYLTNADFDYCPKCGGKL